MSQTIFYGDQVTFHVGVVGSEPLAYQWLRNGASLDGATSSDYTISNVSSNDQGAAFCVQITNSFGAATSQVAVLTVDYGVPGPPQIFHLLSYNDIWKYNQIANLDGVNWTAPEYDDSTWPSGPGLLGFENNPSIVPLIETTLDDPRVPPPGLSADHAYYFRTTIQTTGEVSAATMTATFRCDDGAMVYFNGQEAQRIRMPSGTITNMSFATAFPLDPSGGSDATADEYFTPETDLLAGTNVIAVSVHQRNASSSDVVWGMALDFTLYPRIRDTNAPVLVDMIPTPGTTVPSLSTIEVHFSEGVKGVEAGDLLLNGAPATSLTAYAPDVYVFQFPPPPTGVVQVAWSGSQAITDLSANSNRFAGGTYTYTVNSAAVTRGVRINEFMAGNTSTIRDNDGHYSDWLELYNAQDQPVSLAGWFLTDNVSKLTKWQFPAGVVLAAKSYLLIWASGLDRTNPAAPLHTNFKLDKAAGNFLGLVSSDGTTIISGFSLYPQQFDDISYGRDRLDPSLVGYYTNPTPGAANAILGPGVAPEVQFSVASGTFLQPFTLNLSTADSNSVIRYLLVTNGTSPVVTNVPTRDSAIYSGPLTITNSIQVRARAFSTLSNYLPGPVRNETYLQIAPSAANFSSDLPVVVFHNMGGGAVAATADQFMTMQVFETRNGRSSLLNPPDLAVQGYFHRRGQATFWNPKANLRVETQNAYGDDLDVELLGMPAENDWVFYGIDEFDKVLTHNPLTHDLFSELGYYTSHTRYVEVYLKDDSGIPGPITSADYNGLYVLEEKIKIGKNRVAIDQLQPQDTNAPNVTGGYLLSIDKSNPGSPEYLAGASVWFLDPDYYEMTSPMRAAQRQYIDSYFNNFYAALTGPNWTNPITGYAGYIDLESWIDIHLHNTFVFNVDMLRISAYFYKPRGGKLVQGPLWDFDRAFADSDDGRGFNPRRWRSADSDGGTDPFNPGSTFSNPWYGKMFKDPDFWQRWIDRYQQLRRTTYSLTNLYTKIDYYGNLVRQATAREYARWRGSGGSDTSPRSGNLCADGLCYSFPGTWQGEINFTKYWFSNRVDFMDSNFLNPPVFSSSGGPITPGFVLTLTAPTREANSTLYYTLDGTDPRLPGGAVSPRALSSLNSAQITLSSNARVVARNWNTNHHNLTGANNPPISSLWSGPVAGTFVVATPTLAVTEIMYHPGAAGAGTNDDDDFEFVELKNVGAAPVNLAGVRFTNGIDFTFSATNAVTNLAAGQYVVIVRNQAAFRSRYPAVTNIAGQYNRSLDNGGERLYLEGSLKEPILDFRYDNQWYPVTDGAGFSLVARNENAPFNTWTNPASWRASTASGGSPGATDPAPSDIPAVIINEALTHTDLPQVDSVELFNPTLNSVFLGGWFLTDDPGHPTKYRIPDGTWLGAGDFLVFTEDQFNHNGSNSFALSSLGDEIYLFSGDGTNITGYRHGFAFGAQANGATFGRYVTSDGREHFVTEERNTMGGPNVGPRVGPIVINEIMYAPPPFGLDADTVDEYIELRNITGQPVSLFDRLHPTNSWRLEGAVRYTFPPGVVMAPWSYLLLVSFDPVSDPASLNWFLGRYGLDTNVLIYGPFQGHLGRQGERIALEMPDPPELPPSSIAGFVPYVLAEAVHYSSSPPWPAGADASGKSLQRLASVAFGDEPANWQAAPPTPGGPNAGADLADTDGDGLPDEWELAHGLDPKDATGPNGAWGDPDGDGSSNWQEFIAGTDPFNGQDFLRFEAVFFDGSACVLQFITRVGRTYAIEFVTDLSATASWTTLTANIAGNGSLFTFHDSVGDGARFYRLRVSRN